MKSLSSTALKLEKPLNTLRENLLPETEGSLRWHSVIRFGKLRKLRQALRNIKSIIESPEGHELFPELWRDEYIKWFEEQIEKLEQLKNAWRRGWSAQAKTTFTAQFAREFNRHLRLLITDFAPVVEEARGKRRTFLQTASLAALAFATGCGFRKEEWDDGYYIRMEVCLRRERALEQVRAAEQWGIEAAPYRAKDGRYHVLFKGSYINAETAAATLENIRRAYPSVPRDRDFAIVHVEDGIVEWQKTIVGERHQARRVAPGIYIQLGAFKELKSAYPLADEGAIIHRIPEELHPTLPYRAFNPRRYETVNEAFLDLRSVSNNGEAGIAEVFADGWTRWLSRTTDTIIAQTRNQFMVTKPLLDRLIKETADEPFAAFVGEAIKRYPLRNGRFLSPVLVHAIKRVESENDPQAKSHAGAIGLMQLMRGTFKQYLRASRHPRREWAQKEPQKAIRDPEINIDAGTYYLAWLMDYFDYDAKKAVTAYNAGPGRVRSAAPLSRESRAYRQKVLVQTQDITSNP
ncbi:lytic transglycosylase domain-containing protein [Candidatus Woesearchaeota archaeon]|nr:MAG: lytic transglycosylase domain-containing protein [Candidatus Woesearchaeota archaeon]